MFTMLYKVAMFFHRYIFPDFISKLMQRMLNNYDIKNTRDKIFANIKKATKNNKTSFLSFLASCARVQYSNSTL